MQSWLHSLSEWKNKKRYSLSTKLLMLFFVVSLVFVVIVGGSGSYYFKHHFKDRIMPHLFQYLEYVRHDIGIPADLQKAQTLADQLNITIAIIDERGVWTSSGQVLLRELIEEEYSYTYQGVRYSEIEIGRQEYAGMHIDGTIFLFDLGGVKHHKRPRALVPLVFLLLMAFVLYRATRRLFAPILDIQHSVKRIGSGELDHRVDIQRNDELGLLADDINEMAAELQKMLDAKRQLLLAVSHELRSPLTRTNVAIEMLEQGPLKEQIKEDMQEMEQLIADILDMERLSTHHSALDCSQQEVGALCQHVINRYFHQEGIQFDAPPAAVVATIDEARCTLLLKNLLANAVKYQQHKTTLTLRASQEVVELTVCDDGQGIDPQHIPHLMEPFYRVDPARQRQTGGYGLGLYLCRVITEAHGGAIAITSQPAQGTCVAVTLPLVGR